MAEDNIGGTLLLISRILQMAMTISMMVPELQKLANKTIVESKELTPEEKVNLLARITTAQNIPPEWT